jgi:hypothetical protein
MKFTLEITCDNSAFEGHDETCAEVGRIIIKAARKVMDGQGAGPLHDINGNKVGSFQFDGDEN